jgi:YHS domain-containing protein/thiol-disulfide isomerase/thioredoxin
LPKANKAQRPKEWGKDHSRICERWLLADGRNLAMLRSVQFSVVAVVLSLIALTANAQPSGINWRTDLDAARAEARQTNRLVLVHFWSVTCGPCKLLDRDVFSQPQVGAVLEQKYVPVKVNAGDARVLTEALGITRVPTDVVMTPEGTVIERMVSPNTPMAYVGKMNEVATKFASQPSRPYNDAIAKVGQTPPVSPQSTNSAYSGLAVPAAPAMNTSPQGVANPYAAALAQQQAAAAPVQTASAQPAAPPAVMSNNYAATPPEVTAAAPQQAPAVTPQLPAGSPPLGFDGFCPVTMKKQWKWTRGDVRYGAVHRGRTYLFTSAEAQAEFLKSPDAYSPVLSGADPVLAMDAKQNVPGQRAFALEYRGQFYLFSSQETLTKFRDNADAYSQGVQQAMNPAGGKTLR